jgi:hypothetical protein
MDQKFWSEHLWNTFVLTLCILLLVFGGLFMFRTPEIFQGVVKSQGIQVFIIIFALPVITFLLATDKISKEAGLSLLGAIIGYAFGKGL